MPSAKPRVAKSDDAFRSIGEAAKELGLEPHVLRYWEGKFPKHVRPLKRDDGRRMFRPRDIEALRAIQILVHQRGMTLKGAKALLLEQGVDAVLTGEARVAALHEARDAGGSGAVSSPAKELQESVMQAFEAQLVAQATVPATGDSDARLRAVLEDITDLKRRLDEARRRRAA